MSVTDTQKSHYQGVCILCVCVIPACFSVVGSLFVHKQIYLHAPEHTLVCIEFIPLSGGCRLWC